MNEHNTSIEDVKRLLLSGKHFNKKDLERENYLNSSCLPQRIYDLRHLAKHGCLDWDIKYRSVPGKGTLREYWLEPSEIERIKSGLKRDEQSLKEEENIAPQVLNDALNEAQESEDRAYYEQTSLLIGGSNLSKRW